MPQENEKHELDAGACKVFISYAHRDGSELARRLADDLGACSWIDLQELRAGDRWEEKIEVAIDAADVVLALLSPGSYVSDICRGEQMRAYRKGKCVIPILVHQTELPIAFETLVLADFTDAGQYAERFAELLDNIRARRGSSLKNRYRTTYVTAPPLPLNYFARPEVLDTLLAAVLRENGNRHIALIGLHGMGGIGKTILALALCHSEHAQEAFPDGIAWVTLGREGDPDLAGKLREIAKVLGDDLAHYDTHAACVNRYRTVIRERAALVVVDDVWNAQDLEPFLAESPRSRLLFTTRDAGIAAAVGAEGHYTELLTPDQSREFLARWAGIDSSQLPTEAADIIIECGRLPLALAMIGATLRGKPAQHWKTVLNILASADLGHFRALFPNYPHPNLFAAIQVSVDALDPDTRCRYLALAVLLEDTRITTPILQSLWSADESEANGTVDHLVTLSLVQRETDAVRLHDLQVDFIRAQHPDPGALKLIHGAMRLAGYVFSDDPHQFASQVTGRLLPHRDDPVIGRFLDSLRRGAPRPWLRPIFPALISPGEPLLHTRRVDRVMDLAPSPDPNRVILTCSSQVVILDVHTFRETLRHPCVGGRCMAVSRAAGRAFYATSSALVLWDARTGEDLQTHQLSGIRGLDINSDGTRIILHLGKSVHVWDVVAGKQILQAECEPNSFPQRSIDGVALTPAGELAIYCRYRGGTGSNERDHGSIVVHDLVNGLQRFELTGHNDRINDVRVTPDGRWVVSAGSDATIRVWSLQTGKLVHLLKGHQMEVLCIASSPDSRWLVSGSYDQSVRLWDLETGRLVDVLGGHSAPVQSAAVSSDGTRAVSWARDDSLKIWDLRGAERAQPDSHAGFVKGVAFVGRERVVTASSDATLKLWSAQTGRVTHTLTGHTDKIASLALSTDHRFAVSGDDDGCVKVWDIDAAREVLSKNMHGGGVRSVSVSSDGLHAASVAGDGGKVWDIATGHVVGRFDEGTDGSRRSQFDNCLEFSPCGTRLLIGMSRGTAYVISIWDVTSQSPVGALKGHKHTITALAISPDGHRAVSGCHLGELIVWDLQSNQPLRRWQAHESSTVSLAFSPDGQRVVSASGDCRMRVWEPRSGRLIATFTFDRSGRSCAYGPDDVIVGGDKTGRVYWLKLESNA